MNIPSIQRRQLTHSSLSTQQTSSATLIDGLSTTVTGFDREIYRRCFLACQFDCCYSFGGNFNCNSFHSSTHPPPLLLLVWLQFDWFAINQFLFYVSSVSPSIHAISLFARAWIECVDMYETSRSAYQSVQDLHTFSVCDINWKFRLQPTPCVKNMWETQKLAIFQGIEHELESEKKDGKTIKVWRKFRTNFSSNCCESSFSSCAIIYEAILFSMKFTILFPSHRGRREEVHANELHNRSQR